jgi:hypothetical protein
MSTGRVRRLSLIAGALSVGLVGGGAIGFLAQGQPLRPPTDSAPTSETAPGASGPTAPGGVLPLPTQEGPTSAAPTARPDVPDTLLAWIPGGLPPGMAEGVRRLRGVDHVVSVVSGTAWMDASFDADGTPVDRAPAGYAIPLDVAGADLGDYAPFLAPADRTILPQLAEGQVALGSSSAQLRRLGAGGQLTFADGTLRLQVAGVRPDAAIGAHEVFASRATAAKLGITRDRYLLVDPSRGISRSSLSARIRALAPPGAVVQIRGPGETPFFRYGDAVLPSIVLKEDFGEFAGRPVSGGWIQMDPRWQAEHIVTAAVPILGHVQCNRAIVPQLRGALADIQAAGLASLIDPRDYGGCFASRYVNLIPDAGISHHSWGAAIDINVSSNPYGHTPHQDPRIVAIFERWGFTWGGRWLRPDGMHFEFSRFASGA